MINNTFIINNSIKETYKLITPDNSNIELTGRIDNSNQIEPVLIWQGTELRSKFTGKKIGLRFTKGTGKTVLI